MSDEDTVKERLRRMARRSSSESPTDPSLSDTDYRDTIERAAVALDDLYTAARFVDDGGLDDLERALEAAERSVSACAGEGRETLSAFQAFQTAADGEHFQSGHGTSLRDGTEAGSK